jgi:iron(III) transport system permease protein
MSLLSTKAGGRWPGVSGRWARALSGDRLAVGGAIAAAAYLLVPPIAFTIYSAFRTPAARLPFEQGVSWSFANITRLYTSGTLQSTLGDTTIFVAGSVTLALVIGFVLAWLVERTDLPLRGTVFVLLLFPLMMPGLVTTMGWLLLLGERTGMVNVVIRAVLPFWEVGPFDVFSMYGMVVVQGFNLVALMFIFIGAALRNVDPVLEEASRTSGASFFTTLRRVTLPVLRPSILGLVMLAIILTVESFEVPLLLAGGAGADIFSTRLYFALNDASGAPPAYGTVAALGLHFMALTYVLFFLYHRLVGDTERYVTLAGRGYRAKRYELNNWRWAILAAIGLFLLVTSVAPFLVLLWTSFLPNYVQPGAEAIRRLSLDQYGALLSDRRLVSAWLNTLLVAVAAPTISVGVTLVIAWVVTRAKGAAGLRVALDLFLSSSIAIPGVVAANAMLLFYLRANQLVPSWFPLYGTVLVLVLVYSYRMAVAYRVNRAGVMQVAREMEDASYTSGASQMQTFRRVVLPLVSPTAFAAWVLLFLVAFREFTLPLVVGRESPPFVVSVLIWKLWGQHAGQAAALGVLTVVFLSAVLLGLRLFVFRRLRRF